MILFTILVLIVLIVGIIAVAVLSVSGAAFLLLFGDLLACCLFIWLVAKLFKRKKRK